MAVDPHSDEARADEARADSRPDDQGNHEDGDQGIREDGAAATPEPAIEPAATASMRALLGQDVRRCARLLAWGCAGLAVFEAAAALIASPAQDTRVLAAVRLVFLSFALLALLWLMLVPVVVGGAVAARLALAAYAPDRARAWRGWLAPAPPGLQPATAWLWAGGGGALVYLTASSYATFRAITYFKEPQLTSLLLAMAQLVLFAVSGGLALGIKPLARRAGDWLDSWLARREARATPPGRPAPARRAAATWLRQLNPLTRVGPALAAMLLIGMSFLGAATLLLPQLGPKIPWRHILALAVLAAAAHGAASYLERRGRRPGRPPRPLRRLGVAAGGVILFIGTLLWIGADHEAKSVATTGSPLLSDLVDVVRKSADFDGDGFGFLLGENDCAPFAADIHPLARDIADNGLDEDCNG
ncbi:MAG TPA: hypothetical protein VNM90_23360, partial [Haliangium sp.]|nr:hypothetical protein [Haliangium sp.]